MSDPIVSPHRICTKCHQEYPAAPEYFYREKKSPDGLQARCKKCANAYGKSWAAQNREKSRAIKTKWRTTHYEQKRQSDKRYRRENQSVVVKRSRDYKRAHPERTRMSRQKYYWNHRPQIFKHCIENAHRRRARKRNLPCAWTKSDWERALDYWDNRCAVCGRPRGLWHTLARDHWIPLANPDCPGTIPTNMVPLCHDRKGGTGGCNASKRNRNPLDWLTEKLGKRKAKKKLAEIEAYFEWVRNQSGNGDNR